MRWPRDLRCRVIVGVGLPNTRGLRPARCRRLQWLMGRGFYSGVLLSDCSGGSALVLQLFRGLRSPVAVACSIILAPPPPSAPQPIPPPATIAQTHAAQSTPSSPRNRVALPRTPLGSISHISGNYSSSPRPPYKMRPVSNMEPTCAALSVPPPLHTSREDASMKLAAVLFLAALAVTGARLQSGGEKPKRALAAVKKIHDVATKALAKKRPKKEQVSVVSRCALSCAWCGGGRGQ